MCVGMVSRPAPVFTREEVVERVARFVVARHALSRFAIVGGSLVRGGGTRTSDADLLVLTDDPAAPCRESSRWEELPVEAFVHTAASYGAYVAHDAEDGEPVLVQIAAEGVVVHDPAGLAPAFQAEARRMLEAGPAPLSAARLEDWRYLLTDAVEDLEGLAGLPWNDAVAREAGFAIGRLMEQLGQFRLRQACRWSGNGKWLYRHLANADPTFLGQLVDAAAECRRGQVGPIIALVDETLGPHGGRLFDGYRRAGSMPPGGSPRDRLPTL